MRFFLYSINYSPELTGIGKYNGDLIPALSKREVETYTLTAQPYYPNWQIDENYKNCWSTEYPESGTVFRCPLYVPSKPTTLKRLLHLCSFALTSCFKLMTLIRLKPDVLFLVQPTLFCAPFALVYCKLTGAKSVMHIQDFEVDAMLGLGMSSNALVKRVAHKCESWLMRRFDAVSTISYSMVENAIVKGVEREKVFFFPNWSDTGFVTPDVCGEAIKRELGLSDYKKIVLYSGNIGQKQGLEIVLDAAQSFSDSQEIHFVVIGSGSYRVELESLAKQLNLKNITFLDLQPWERVPEILAMADVHLVVQKKGAADAVLPSKLTNILSAGGHALVTAEENTELGLLANKHPGIFTLVEPENSSAFTQSLECMLNSSLRGTNQVARDYALNNLAKDEVINRFIKDLHDICAVEAKQDKETIG